MRTETHPLAVLQLKGTQEEMGKQFGEIMKEIGEYEPIFDFYPVMAQNLLLGSLPRNKRNLLTKTAVSFLMKIAQNRMRNHRPEEFSLRTLASLKSAGKSPKIEKDLFTMDAFQNAIGVLGLFQILPEAVHYSGYSQQIGACTSVGVWGEQSEDGKLYHARNFDFPGVGVWDVRPILVFCTPNQGLKYGYVACRGADVPGITSFNEAGLTLSFHTRFHKRVGFDGMGVIDFGHKIISEARTIKEAVEIARKNKIDSTWGAILTNYKEKGPKAAIIETNYGNIDVTYNDPKESSIINTNHYQSERFKKGEILASPVFYHHCIGRYERAKALLASQKRKGTSVQDLQKLLDDSSDAETGQRKTMGSTIRQISSVKSVIMSPETKRIFISVGTAPTGSGPYLEIPMKWGAPGYKILTEKDATSPSSKKRKNTPDLSVLHYKNAMLLNDDLSLKSTENIATELKSGSISANEDSSLYFLRAVLMLENGKFKEAGELLEEAEKFERSPFRKQQTRLWLARTQSALGKKASSAYFYDLVRKDTVPLGDVWKKKAFSDKGKYSPKRLRNVTPNFLLVDANEL